MIDSEELLGQLHAYANNRHHSFVTLQQMARESAAAIEELRAQIAAKDAELAELKGQWERLLANYASADDRAEKAEAQIAAKDAEISRCNAIISSVMHEALAIDFAKDAQLAAKDAALRHARALIQILYGNDGAATWNYAGYLEEIDAALAETARGTE